MKKKNLGFPFLLLFVSLRADSADKQAAFQELTQAGVPNPSNQEEPSLDWLGGYWESAKNRASAVKSWLDSKTVVAEPREKNEELTMIFNAAYPESRKIEQVERFKTAQLVEFERHACITVEEALVAPDGLAVVRTHVMSLAAGERELFLEKLMNVTHKALANTTDEQKKLRAELVSLYNQMGTNKLYLAQEGNSVSRFVAEYPGRSAVLATAVAGICYVAGRVTKTAISVVAE